MDPKIIVQKLRDFRKPKSNAGSWAAFQALWHWSYNIELSVARNVLDYEKLIGSYDETGEKCSERQKREIFVQGLPIGLKKKVMDQI